MVVLGGEKECDSFWGLLQNPNDHRSVPAFVERESRKPFIKSHPQYTRPGSNLNLSVFGSLVHCESITLNHEVTEAGNITFEMIDFHNNNIGLSHSEQYRWLQVLYQVGVFVSRSSVNIIKIHQIWLMCLLQKWVSEDKREFSMGITSLADAVGIGLAGFISIPVHNEDYSTNLNASNFKNLLVEGPRNSLESRKYIVNQGGNDAHVMAKANQMAYANASSLRQWELRAKIYLDDFSLQSDFWVARFLYVNCLSKSMHMEASSSESDLHTSF
uniref:Uncharacterized protein n=1 Tax=Timema poppense TaxID=170557 RepID=A0A7R9CYC2_TIMPO|nr:unnamed protein product [Timema poppensis]